MYVKTKEDRVKNNFKKMIQEPNKILNIIGFVDFNDRTVEWNSRDWKVFTGNLAKAFLLVTLLKVRTPLFMIEKDFAGN